VPLLILLAVILAAAVLPQLLGGASAPAPAPRPNEDASNSQQRLAEARTAARPAAERAVRWLEAQQRPDGSFHSPRYDRPGTTAVVCWMLLEATGEAHRASVRRALGWLRERADPATVPAGSAYGNYDAAMVLTALFAHYQLAARAPRARDMRAAVTAADRALIRRLAWYCRDCATPEQWGYQCTFRDRPAGAAPRLGVVSAAWVGDASGVAAVSRHHRRFWRGDNSNAGYGWMGLRAAALLGVAVMDDAFVAAEIERMLTTRITTGERRRVRIERSVGRELPGFGGMWPALGWEAQVWIGGWSYAHNRQVPSLSAGGAATLAYAWQEAEERGLCDDALRRRLGAAMLGAIGSLHAGADPAVFCQY
jgi:hypothetical protein